MPLPAGYKQTEVGVIPEDWEVKPFGELFSFSNGINADKDCYGRGFRFVNVLEPITYSHIYGPEITGRVAVSDSVATAYAVKFGDVLFNRTSETDSELGLATTYLGTEHVLFGGFVIRAHPADDSFDPKYSGYALRAHVVRSQIVPMGQGAVRANIGQQNLKLVLAPVPPLPEQRAIAEALSDADALIESVRQLVTKKRHLKLGVMHDLLTGTIRLPGFNGDWNAKALKDVLKIPVTDGPHMTPVFLSNGVPFLSVNNLANNKIDLSDLRFISQHDHAIFSKKCKPQKNDILLGKAASVGKVAIVDIDIEFNIWSPIALVRIDSANVPKFIYYCLQSDFVMRQIVLLTNSSSQGNIGMGDIERLELLLPSQDEQYEIAAMLTEIDTEIADLESQLAKARSIKQGMMNRLLTGKIRLL